MKIAFFSCRNLLNAPIGLALRAGARTTGDELIWTPMSADLKGFQAALVLNHKSKYLIDRLTQAGLPYVFVDRGYDGNSNYWRVSINSVFPTRYLGCMGSSDARRKEVFGWKLCKWRVPKPDSHVLIVSGTEFYHSFYELAPPQEWANEIYEYLKDKQPRPVICRTSKKLPLQEHLFNCHVCIVHGSHVGLWAQLRGIPCIAVGPGIVGAISYKDLTPEKVDYPYLAGWDQREAWLNDVAHTQYSATELCGGVGWEHIRDRILVPAYNEP